MVTAVRWRKDGRTYCAEVNGRAVRVAPWVRFGHRVGWTGHVAAAGPERPERFDLYPTLREAKDGAAAAADTAPA